MNEDSLPTIITALRQVQKIIGGFDPNWFYYLEQANTIWKRCPFQVGDRVELTETPEISKEARWGWLGAKHFLINGAKATVKQREFHEGQFSLGLEFDEDTWIDMQGNKQLPNSKGLYYFTEQWIKGAT